MSDERRKRGGFWLPVLLVISVYVGGYIAFGDFKRVYLLPDLAPSTHRTFQFNAMQFIYAPIAWFECRIRKEPVLLWGKGDELRFEP